MPHLLINKYYIYNTYIHTYVTFIIPRLQIGSLECVMAEQSILFFFAFFLFLLKCATQVDYIGQQFLFITVCLCQWVYVCECVFVCTCVCAWIFQNQESANKLRQLIDTKLKVVGCRVEIASVVLMVINKIYKRFVRRVYHGNVCEQLAQLAIRTPSTTHLFRYWLQLKAREWAKATANTKHPIRYRKQ